MAVQTVQLMLVTTVKGQQVLTPIQTQLKGIGAAANAANPSIVKMQQNLSGFGESIAKSLSNIRGTIVGLGTAMAVIGSAQIFASSVKSAIDFEKEMANVSTILDTSTISLKQMKEQVIALDGSLGSSSEQAKALYQALSTGVEPAKAVEFVGEAAAFAKANLADLDAATLLLATTMNVYGDRISSVSHLTDVFSQTIKTGVITGEQLVASLGTVINTAALAEISIEEVAAAIATLTSAGIPAQQATTALNQAILGFINPSKNAQKAAEQLGVELSLVKLQEDGLVVSMQNLAKIVELDKSLLSELFGEVRAFKGVAALTGEQMEFFAEQANLMTDGIDGLTQSMLKLQQQSLSAQLETAINNINKSLQGMYQTVIDQLTPAIVSASEKIQDFIRDIEKGEYDNFVSNLVKIKDNLNNVAEAVAQLIIEFGKLGTLETIFEPLINNVIKLTDLFKDPATSNAVQTLAEKIDYLIKVAMGISDLIVPVERMVDAFILGRHAFEGLVNQNWAAFDAKLKEIQNNSYNLDKSFIKLDAGIDKLNTKLPLHGAAAGIDGLNAAADAGDLFSDTIIVKFPKAGKAVEDVDKKTQSLVDSFNKLINPSTAVLEKIIGLQKAGFTTEEILRGMSKEITAAADAEYVLGEAVDAGLISWLKSSRVIEQNKKILNGWSAAAKEAFSIADEGTDAGAAISNAMKERMKWLEENSKDFWELQRKNADFNTKEMLQKLIERHQNFISAVDDVMGDGYGTIFENLKKIALEKYGTMVTEIQKKDATMRAAILASIALLGQGFIKLGNIIGGTSGALMVGIGTFANNLIKALSEGMKKIQAFAVAAASAINIVVGSLSKSKESQMGGAIGSTIGGIAGGIIGSVVPVIGTAIGAMLGSAIGGAIGAGIGSAFAKDYSKEIKKFAASLGFWISQELSEAIAETVEKMSVSADLAVLLNLDKVAEDLGVTTNNLNYFIAAFEKAMATFQEGSTLFADVVADLDKTLPAMIEAGTDGLGRWNAELLAFIQRLQEAGIEVKALTDAINSQFAAASDALNELISDFGENVTAFVDSTAAAISKAIQASLPEQFRDEAEKFLDRLLAKNLSIEQVITQMLQKFPQLDLSKLIGGIEGGIFTADMIKNQSDFLDFFTLITAEINKMLASGMSVQEVFSQLGGSIQILRDAAIDLGLRGDPAFRSLMALFRMMNSESAKTLGNLNTLMTAFNNLGLMTQKNFTTFENIFLKVFQKFNKDGHISRLELQAMVPTLAQLRANAAQYGYELDAATQAMIALAIKRGLLPEEMPVDPMVEFARVMREDVVPAVQELTATLATAFGIVTALDGQSIDITTSVTPTGNIDWTKWLNNPPSFQGITSPVAFTVRRKEQPMLVHQGEHVTVSPANSQTFLGREVEPIDVPINFVDYNTDQKIGEAVISLGVRNGTPFVVTKKGRRG